jgi:hypothetical protein
VDVAPGTHKLKVYRDGTKPFMATIQVSASNRYDALLVPTDESRRKFDAQLAKFEKVKTMALARNAQMEREGVRTDGIRIDNENSRQRGQAVADFVQSRADIGRTDANSRAAETAGRVDIGRTDANSRAVEAAGRVDVRQTDAQSRKLVAAGEAAVLRGKAAVLNERSKGEAKIADAEADVRYSGAEATRKAADGKLAVQQATAANLTTVARYQNEALKEQVSAMRSFAESLGNLGFRLLAQKGR